MELIHALSSIKTLVTASGTDYQKASFKFIISALKSAEGHKTVRRGRPCNKQITQCLHVNDCPDVEGRCFSDRDWCDCWECCIM
jgi:hypothetical protein